MCGTHKNLYVLFKEVSITNLAIYFTNYLFLVEMTRCFVIKLAQNYQFTQLLN